LLLALLVLPQWVLGQGSISGKVINADSKAPLAKVSVFLSNATYGTITDDEGNFVIRNIKPGQYQLVMTSVGYEDYTQSVLINEQNITVNGELKRTVMQLRDVVITTPADWKRNYEMFLTEFFGTSAFAKQCQILNPHELTLLYHKSTKTLEAYSYDFVIIENKALGYRIKFLLKDFKSDKLNDLLSWQGRILYEELPGSASQKKKWEERREEIYYGSSLHFYRSLVNGQFEKDGFVMRILARRPDPKRPNDAVINKKLDRFANGPRDSAKYWYDLYNSSKWISKLYMEQLKPEQVVQKTGQDGLYALSFPECLYITYTKKREMQEFKDIYRPLDMENFETSVLTLFKPFYIVFDKNGAVVSLNSNMFEGTWTKNKIAELLPVDYTPPAGHVPSFLKRTDSQP
jgi:hypothetical protein